MVLFCPYSVDSLPDIAFACTATNGFATPFSRIPSVSEQISHIGKYDRRVHTSRNCICDLLFYRIRQEKQNSKLFSNSSAGSIFWLDVYVEIQLYFSICCNGIIFAFVSMFKKTVHCFVLYNIMRISRGGLIDTSLLFLPFEA